MMRRKGVPEGGCGMCCRLKEKLDYLWEHTMGAIMKIRNITPDGDGNFDIQAGNNIEIADASNGIVIGMQSPLTDDLEVHADVIVDGDIIQRGSSYETHAEHVFSADDYIVMRDGAIAGLAQGDYSGFQVKKYDGVNDGRLVIDRDGTARVGDVGDEQPLATRDESSDLTNDHLVKWDAANLKLVDAGVGTDGMLELYDEGSYTTGALTPHNTYSVGIPMSAGKSFETGYDYFINVTCISDFEMNIKSTRDIESPGNTSISIQMQAGSTSSPTLTYAVYRISNGGNAPVVNVIGMCSVRQQVKLVSGTNIKTINGNSLLGSGDLQISSGGGGVWTMRTANDDWTDIFDNTSSANEVTAKKNIIMCFTSTNLSDNTSLYCYIPKGLKWTNNLDIITSGGGASGSNLYINTRFKIYKSSIQSSSSTITRENLVITPNIDFDNKTFSFSVRNNSGSVRKSNFTIYTSD